MAPSLQLCPCPPAEAWEGQRGRGRLHLEAQGAEEHRQQGFVLLVEG